MSTDNDGDALADGFDNTHRAFLQALLARQSLTLEEAKPLLAAIESAKNSERPTLAEDITLDDLNAYVSQINTAISSFDLEVRTQLHQRTRERVWALVNCSSDAPTQLATMRTPDELAFIKRVLDAMFETFNKPSAEIMAVDSMQAVRLAKGPAVVGRDSPGATQSGSSGLTMTHAEKVLDSLVAEDWFEKSSRNFYSLTPRALMELRGWLVDTYNVEDQADDDDDVDGGARQPKIKFCSACRDIVTVGQRCLDASCPARLHKHCVQKVFRAQGGREECPVCSRGWEGTGVVGEEAARGPSSRTSNGRRSGAGIRSIAREDDESDE